MNTEVTPLSERIAPKEHNPLVLKFARQKNHVAFVWGESCCGQKKDGPQTAPQRVCSEEFLAVIRSLGWKPSIARAPQVFKPSPQIVESGVKCYEPFSVFATCENVRQKIAAAHDAGAFPIMLGGDHCLAMGSVAASLERQPNLGVLWFDAHADINTPLTSPTGNMHGMPLAALMNLRDIQKAPGFEHRYPILKPERVAYIGLRDVDDGEKRLIQEMGLSCAFDMEDLKRYGMKELIKQVIKKLCPTGTEPLHLSFDVDGMDPAEAPSTGTPVADGVRLHEALEMIQYVRSTGCLYSMDVVEVNPSLGTEEDAEVTITNAQLVMAHTLGYTTSRAKL